MNIGYDCDNVSLDLETAFKNWHNKEYNTHFDDSFALKPRVWELDGDSHLTSLNKFRKFMKSEYFTDVFAIKGFLYAARSLSSKKHVLSVPTTRPGWILERKTREWYALQFGTKYEEIFNGGFYFRPFMLNWDLDHKVKSEMCRKAKLDVLIEDDYKVATECLIENPNLRALLFTRGHNKDLPIIHPRMQRVSGHFDVLDKIKELEKARLRV